jgi:hypothetical protein
MAKATCDYHRNQLSDVRIATAQVTIHPIHIYNASNATAKDLSTRVNPVFRRLLLPDPQHSVVLFNFRFGPA